MKVIRGGGGVDADGNAYKLPEEEIEVPDDHFETLHKSLMDLPCSNYVMVSKGFWDIFNKSISER